MMMRKPSLLRITSAPAMMMLPGVIEMMMAMIVTSRDLETTTFYEDFHPGWKVMVEEETEQHRESDWYRGESSRTRTGRDRRGPPPPSMQIFPWMREEQSGSFGRQKDTLKLGSLKLSSQPLMP
jgi:hypothetical protein